MSASMITITVFVQQCHAFTPIQAQQLQQPKQLSTHCVTNLARKANKSSHRLERQVVVIVHFLIIVVAYPLPPVYPFPPPSLCHCLFVYYIHLHIFTRQCSIGILRRRSHSTIYLRGNASSDNFGERSSHSTRLTKPLRCITHFTSPVEK